MSLTSVLLPVYNGERYLESAIRSVLAQDGDLELLVQDDASTDRSAEIARSFVDPRVKYARNEKNAGCWATLQAAAERSGGELLRLFSHDDLMLADDIPGAERCLLAAPECGVCISDYEMIDSEGEITGSSLRYDFLRSMPDRIQGTEAAWYLFEYGCISGTQSTVTVRRSVFDEVGGFDAWMKYTGDFMFLAKAATHGGLVYDRRVTSRVRFHPMQTSKQGQKYLVYFDEMHAVLEYLRSRMSPSDQSRARREFNHLYGHQFIHRAIKGLRRGDASFLRHLVKLYGWPTITGALVVWSSMLPGRLLRRRRASVPQE